MAKNEDVNQANSGAPAADIPDLKKKEKERKKAGAAWGGAKPGGGSFTGATGAAGGTVARAAASAASATGGAAVQAAGAGWLSSTIAGLTATVLGKAVLAASLAMIVGGVGMVGYSMFMGGTGAAGGASGDLGAISSSMKVRAGGGDRTGYVASNGEIMFDPLKKAEAKKEPEKAPEDKTAAEAAAPAQTADAAGQASDFKGPGLEHNLSGAKLSSSLGGAFGGKNIFSGNNSAPKLNDGLSKVSIKGAQKGQLAASRVARTGRVSSGARAKGGKSNKAFGQLKVAKGMSMLGAGQSGAEGSRASAASAFDGSEAAGNVEGSAGPQTGAVDSPSTPNGAPDMTAPNVETPTGVAAGPDTAQALAGIAALAKQAGEMKKMGTMLIAIGVVLLIVATQCGWWGFLIAAIALMLIGVGKMMLDQAAQMKAMADQMSQALAARTEDVKQDEINKYCINKAYNEGTDPKDCNPPDSVTENSRVLAEDQKALGEHGDKKKEKELVEETRVEGLNGKPTGQ